MKKHILMIMKICKLNVQNSLSNPFSLLSHLTLHKTYNSFNKQTCIDLKENLLV